MNFDQINILLSGAKAALKDTQTAAADDAGRKANARALENMCTPLNLSAIDKFIKGLKPQMAGAVDAVEFPIGMKHSRNISEMFQNGL